MAHQRSELRKNPREVVGYGRAVELKLTPQVPPTAPTPAFANSRHLLLGSIALSLGGLIGILTLASQGAVGWLMGVASFAVVFLVIAMLKGVREVQWREFQAGYCRMDFMVASFTRDPEARFPAAKMKGAPWDLRGLWRLNDAGEVERKPMMGILPPGHYPSPNRPGELELWTGEAWSYMYEIPKISFLDQPGETSVA